MCLARAVFLTGAPSYILPSGSSALALSGPEGLTERASASCYMGEKVHNNYLMGLIFSTSWRVAPTKIKFLMGIWIFQKRFQK